MKFRIDEEIQALLPALTPEEFNGLKILIELEDHVDDLVVANVNGDRFLMDGHNRFRICKELKRKTPQAREIKFPSKELAVQWVIDNQLSRRNLTDERRSYYRGKEYLNTKQTHGGDRKTNDSEVCQPTDTLDVTPDSVSAESKCHSDTLISDTAWKVAEKHGVSERTVHRDAEFAAAVDAVGEEQGPEAKEAILNGTSGKTKSEVIEEIILCSRCQRLDKPAVNCGGCKTLRAEAKARKKKAAAARKKKKQADAEAAKAESNVDSFGFEVPKKCRDAWGDPWIQSTIDLLTRLSEEFRSARLADGIDKRKKSFPYFNVDDFVQGVGTIDSFFDQLINHLEENRPVAVCPACQGSTCPKCMMSGLVPGSVYESLKEEEAAS